MGGLPVIYPIYWIELCDISDKKANMRDLIAVTGLLILFKFDLWPLTLAFCMDITFVNDNN